MPHSQPSLFLVLGYLLGRFDTQAIVYEQHLQQLSQDPAVPLILEWLERLLVSSWPKSSGGDMSAIQNDFCLPPFATFVEWLQTKYQAQSTADSEL